MPLKAGIASDPPQNLPQIDYQDHHQTAPRMADYMGVRVDQLPDGEYATRAAAHQYPQRHPSRRALSLLLDHEPALKPGGEPSWRIDEVPLEWCFNPAVKLDFRHLPDGYVATPGDVEAELKRIGHTLRPLEIVVVNTAAGRATARTTTSTAVAAWARPRRFGCSSAGYGSSAPTAGAGMRRSRTRGAAQETGDVGLIWEGHRAGREIGYSHLEKLHNLEVLPADGFEIVCFPVKVHRASAGWTRAVAILPA